MALADLFRSRPGVVLTSLDRIERRLVTAGFPALSPWWLATIRTFVRSGRMSLVLRVGRRGGKSSTMCRLAVAIALADAHAIPRGDRGVIAFVSITRDEASARLRTVRDLLDVLGVPYTTAGDTIELTDRPVIIRTFAASWRTAVGFTAIAVFADEVARWRDADDGANPASEVIAAMSPALLSTRGWLVLSSSPLSNVDYHHERFARGDTSDQQVAHAATWEANPTITEADTHALESDPKLWAREYAAIPQSAVNGVFHPDDVEASFRSVPGLVSAQRVIVVDPSSGRRDAWAMGVCGISTHPEGKAFLAFDSIRWWTPEQAKALGAAGIVAAIAAVAKERGITTIHSDQRDSFSLRSLVQGHGLTFREHAWTSTSKPQAVERLRRRFADRSIILPRIDKLRSELFEFEEHVTQNGMFTYGARGTGHDDLVSLCVTACMAEIDRKLQVKRVTTYRPEISTMDLDRAAIYEEPPHVQHAYEDVDMARRVAAMIPDYFGGRR